MNDTQQATEVWTVPGWDEELRCESSHDTGSDCSVEVTHLILTACQPVSTRICQKRFKEFIETGDRMICGLCMAKLSSDCWTVRPI